MTLRRQLLDLQFGRSHDRYGWVTTMVSPLP